MAAKPRRAAGGPSGVLALHNFLQLAQQAPIASLMRSLPTSEDVFALEPQCLALVLPVVFAVFCLLDTGLRVVQFEPNVALLV